ncbi:MAG: NYN domain-containing protein [Pirellulales bacterium]|nr:NYN domain-containing protein [Pirellulales bacterium]
MALLIDGYNLLNATNILGRGRGPGGLERARNALLNTLVESLPAEEVSRTTVVFDASESPWGVRREHCHRGMTVVFASRDEDADTVIEKLIAAHTAPKRLTVVSSDHRLQKAAGRRRATPIDSDRWFRQLLRDRAARSTPLPMADMPKPEGPLTESEVTHWLSEFGLGDSSDA